MKDKILYLLICGCFIASFIGAIAGELLLQRQTVNSNYTNLQSSVNTNETLEDDHSKFNEVNLLGDGQIYKVIAVRYNGNEEVTIILHNLKYNRRRYCVFTGNDYYSWSMLIPGDTIEFVDGDSKSYVIQ